MIHLLKIKFLRIKWYFDLLNYSRTHAKEVDNYKFLLSVRKSAYDKQLELERIEPECPDIEKLKVQVELLDKIINYTNVNN
jgi:hypothetical protein